jgi:hypothetical protein
MIDPRVDPLGDIVVALATDERAYRALRAFAAAAAEVVGV